MKDPGNLSRREFLAATTVPAMLAAIPGFSRDLTGATPVPEAEILDTHVYLGRWPFNSLSLERPAEIAQFLRERGVTNAWVGSFEGLLHKDIAGVNARLFEACRLQGDGLFIPFGSINPTLPDWEDDVRRCHEDFRMPGIRLHPNYHGYGLDDERFSRLLELAAAHGLVVQLVAGMDGENRAYFRLASNRVDLSPLPKQIQCVPGSRVILSNADVATNETWLTELAGLPGVYFDFAATEGNDNLKDFLELSRAARIVFGSGTPLGDSAMPLATLQRVSLPVEQTIAIRHGTAAQLVGPWDADRGG